MVSLLRINKMTNKEDIVRELNDNCENKEEPYFEEWYVYNIRGFKDDQFEDGINRDYCLKECINYYQVQTGTMKRYEYEYKLCRRCSDILNEHKYSYISKDYEKLVGMIMKKLDKMQDEIDTIKDQLNHSSDR